MPIYAPLSAAPGLLDRIDEDNGTGGGTFVVTVYDNDFNTYHQVYKILMEATNCPPEEAEMETWEVDNLGKSVVHHGSKAVCEEAAAIIRKIGIHVTVTEE